MGNIDFITKIAPIMKKEADARGYKICSAAIAQACIESNFGKSWISQAPYWNMYGLKCGKSWKGRSVSAKTKEEYTVGTLTTIVDNFRAYDSLEEGVKGYYDFISTRRYANLKNAISAKQYLEYIKADGYATSSTYVQTNMNIVNKYGLEKYDGFFSASVDYVINNIVKVNTKLNVRNKPVDGAIVGKLLNGEVVKIEEYVDGWYRIGDNKWISANYIISNTGTVAVKTSLNLRKEPNTSCEIIGTLKNGDKIKLLKFENNFYYVLTNDKKVGWCSANYVDLI